MHVSASCETRASGERARAERVCRELGRAGRHGRREEQAKPRLPTAFGAAAQPSLRRESTPTPAHVDNEEHHREGDNCPLGRGGSRGQRESGQVGACQHRHDKHVQREHERQTDEEPNGKRGAVGSVLEHDGAADGVGNHLQALEDHGEAVGGRDCGGSCSDGARRAHRRSAAQHGPCERSDGPRRRPAWKRRIAGRSGARGMRERAGQFFAQCSRACPATKKLEIT